MVRRQVLHYDESDAVSTTGGDRGKEGLNCGQAAGRCADSYDREAVRYNGLIGRGQVVLLAE